MTFVDKVKELLPHITYRDGWEFKYRSWDTQNWSQDWDDVLLIVVKTHSTSKIRNPVTVTHQFEIPKECGEAADYWVLNCIADAERHERCEMFKTAGVAPFFPEHEDHTKFYIIERTR